MANEMVIIDGYLFKNNDLGHLAQLNAAGSLLTGNVVQGEIIPVSTVGGDDIYDLSTVTGKRILGIIFLAGGTLAPLDPAPEVANCTASSFVDQIILYTIAMAITNPVVAAVAQIRLGSADLKIILLPGHVSHQCFVLYCD
jgi:hypothetical protein